VALPADFLRITQIHMLILLVLFHSGKPIATSLRKQGTDDPTVGMPVSFGNLLAFLTFTFFHRFAWTQLAAWNYVYQ
jgi:hypothetical protein